MARYGSMIVPGGGSALDGSKWAACKLGFFVPVRVLSKLFRRLMLEELEAAQALRQLTFFGEHAGPARQRPLPCIRRKNWFVYAKPPLAGPELCSSTSPVTPTALPSPTADWSPSTRTAVTSRYKDYRRKGQERYRTMTLVPGDFIRRLLLHAFP